MAERLRRVVDCSTYVLVECVRLFLLWPYDRHTQVFRDAEQRGEEIE